jgi:hypothetical protein
MYVDDRQYILVHCGKHVHNLQAVWIDIGRGIKNVKRTKRTESMRQVKFECSEEFYQRLNEERFRRNLTLQQLAIRALEWYFTLPESIHRRIDEAVSQAGEPDIMGLFKKVLRETGEVRIFEKSYRAFIKRNPQSSEVRVLMDMIEGHLDHLPIEKLRLLQQSLALDLKYYKSARIKTDIKPFHYNDVEASPATVVPSEDYAPDDRKSKGDD